MRIHKNNAFSLIEILLVVVVVGIMATTLTRLLVRKPQDDWKYVIEELNNLVSLGRQDAIMNQGIYRILFIHSEEGIDKGVLEKQIDDPEKPGAKKYIAASSAYLENEYRFPASIKIRAIYISGKEMLQKTRQGRVGMYIMPDGLIQATVLNLVRMNDKVEDRASFILEPFLGIFEFKEEFYKPE